MRILGIDPGLSCTGYAVLETKPKLHIIEIGVIRTKANIEIPVRLATLFNDLQSVIKDTKPNKAAIETIFVGKNISSALKLGQARGALITAISSNNITLEEYSPTQVKNNITGTGKASKEQVLFMIKNILGIEKIPGPLDASDALAIAYSCYQKNKLS